MKRIITKYRFYLVIIFLGTLAANASFTQDEKSSAEFDFARKLYEDKLYEMAGEQFRGFAQKYTGHEKADDALFLSGKAFFDNQNYDEAIESYKELEITFIQSALLPEARFRLAECLKLQEKFEEAAGLYHRVPVFHPESPLAPKAFLEAGRAYLKANDLKHARDSFLALIQTYPDSPDKLEAYYELINSYFQNGDYKETLSKIDGVFRAYGADFKDPRVYLLRAAIFTKLANTAEAESIYLNLLKEFPKDRLAQEANLHLGVLYSTRGVGEKALPYLDHFITASGQSGLISQAFAQRGDVHFSMGKFAEAEKDYREALSLAETKDKTSIKIKLAQVQSQLGNHEAAEKNLREIISSNLADSSQIGEVYMNLVEVLIKSSDHRDAINTSQEFSRRFPGDEEVPWFYFKNADIFERHLNDYSKALRAYDQFIDTFPFHSDVDAAQLGVARCYQKLGDSRLALREYTNYLERYPAGDDYRVAQRLQLMIGETVPLESGMFSTFSPLLRKFSNDHTELEWHFDLGKAYFEAKDFQPAIHEFRTILQLASAVEVKNETYYRLGHSYFLTAERAALKGETSLVVSYLDSAASSLKFLIANDDSTRWVDEAFLLLTQIEELKIRDTNASESKLIEILTEWEKRVPDSRHGDIVSIKIANELFADEIGDKALLQEALSRYRVVLETYEKSPFYPEALFKEAAALAQLGSDSLAMAKLESFIERFPKNAFSAEALLLKAKLDRKYEDFGGAINNLKKLLSDFYYSPLAKTAQKELADIHFQTGDYQSALKGYQQLQDIRSAFGGTNGAVPETDAMFYQARANENLNQLDLALGQYLDFIHQNPSHPNVPDALLAVARICQKQNNLALAKEYYQKLLNHQAQPAYQFQCQIALGDILFNQELYSDALSRYSAAVKLAANLTAEEYPAKQAVRCRYKLREFTAGDSEAGTFEKKFKDARNAQAQFLIDKGHAYIADKNFELAEKTFKKLRGDFKGSDFGAEGEFGLGKVYLITNHTEEALKTLTEIPAKYPDSAVTPQTYFNLGDFYYKSQQLENAIGAFKKVLPHHKAGRYHQSALRYLIKCYSDMMWWDMAIVTAREYLDTYPRAEDAFDMKIESARLLMNLREYPRAIESFTALQPFATPESEAEIQFYVAQCYREMGNFSRAVAEYFRVKYLTAPTKLPWHVTALFEASKCLISLNEIDQAKTVLKRIVSEEGMGSNFGRFAAERLEELQKEASAGR